MASVSIRYLTKIFSSPTAAVAALIPLLLVFLVAQRYFIRRVQLSGFK